MDKKLIDELQFEAERLGVAIGSGGAERLGRYLDLLLAWNRKINLTAIASPAEGVEKHLIDSLAAAPALAGLEAVVDLGAGGGLPSIPLAVALPGVRFTMADAVGKKVGFLKAAIADLGLANAKAVHARAEGNAAKEGIPVGDGAICRAFLAPAEWLDLARHYVRPGGRIVAMLGAETEIPSQVPAGIGPAQVQGYRLPRSGAERRIVVWSRT